MDTSEVLKEAWAAVEKASLPDKIHEVAFREAVRLVSPPVGAAAGGKSGRAGKSAAGGGGTGNTSGSSATEGSIQMSEDELLAKVVEQTGADQAKLEALVYLDEGVLKISLPGIKLGKNNADKTRTVAKILTIVRGFGLEEDGTSVELIRSEAQRLKCYDPANFAAHLTKLDGYVITGGPNRKVRAKAAGIEAFPSVVDALSAD
jgi:hypothetical protein